MSATIEVLGRVGERMAALGWERGGVPGSVKRGPSGEIAANAGDMTWVKDMEEACEHAERQAIVAEIERRATR